MEDDSVARRKSDQLVRSVTSRIQSRLLGVPTRGGGVGGGDGVSSLYDLLNVDALLSSVEGDLVKFLMAQHKTLLNASSSSENKNDGAAQGETGATVVSQFSSLLDDDEAWDPRIQFMVSFIKDCTKVSIKDQLSEGLDGIRERLRDPASLKVPAEAVVRLEDALFDLLDLGKGGVSSNKNKQAIIKTNKQTNKQTIKQ